MIGVRESGSRSPVSQEERGGTSLPRETYVQLQEGRFHPPRRRSLHFWSLLWSLALSACLGAWGLLLLQGGEQERSWFIEASPLTSVAVYGLYMLDVFRSGTLRYLWRLSSVEDLQTYIARLKSSPPVVWWACECYHDETRTRMVTEYYTEYLSEYDYNSKQMVSRPVQRSRLRQETYQERVVTHSERAVFEFRRFDDVSGEISPEIRRFEATKVFLEKGWEPGDSSTAQSYASERRQFIDRNRSRDVGFNFWEGHDVPGFHARKLVLVDVKNRHAMMHWSIYLLVSTVGGTWPYRRWLDRETVRGTFTIRKLIYR